MSAEALESSIVHVFHPTDFSKASGLAFAHALRVALLARAGLTLFHVDEDGEDTHWSRFPHVRETLERWKLLPPGSSRDAVAELGVDVEKVRAPAGDPVQAMLGYLRDDPAELVVIASHAATGLARLWQKPVAEPLARASGAATLFLPEGARGFVSESDGSVQLRRVLVPVYASPSPEKALGLALNLARALGAEPRMTLLHVGDGAALGHVHVPHDVRGRVERRNVTGPVQDAIVAAAESDDADLVVMATRGHDGVLDALRGSTTERVLRHAKRALLAVPAEAVASS